MAAGCSPAFRRGISRLAIFTGLAAAPLAAGNAVITKPAGQTPLIGALAIDLMHQAGIPKDVVQLAPGSGRVVGEALTTHPLLAGVVFTGSTETARMINRTLAERDGAIIPFVAETGGQNAMIVDSVRRCPSRLPATSSPRRSRAPASAAPPCGCCSCKRMSPTG